jgi:hypothetical protein
MKPQVIKEKDGTFTVKKGEEVVLDKMNESGARRLAAELTPKESGWRERFNEQFCNEKVCRTCRNKECDYSTTGCPWYQTTVFLHSENAEQIIAFIAQVEATAIAATEARILEGIEKLPIRTSDTHYGDYVDVEDIRALFSSKT